MFKDYYYILDVRQQASMQELKSAYRTKSLKWHPDRNRGFDVTLKMQDINEAYAILKDITKRKRYDEEYNLYLKTFKGKDKTQIVNEDSSETQYEMQDDVLKEDIYTAREFAKNIVAEFFKSLKEVSKTAAKGAWEGSKAYIYLGVFLTLIGLIIAVFIRLDPPVDNGSLQAYSMPTFYTPKSWTHYTFYNNAFSIAVPPIVELRKEGDMYTKTRKDLGILDNSDIVVFQQKNLSTNSVEAHSRYCRILIQYALGNPGDFLRSDETEVIDSQLKSFLRSLVTTELGRALLINEPSYQWVCVNDIKVLETRYIRSGNNNNNTSVAIYLLFNYEEMVKMIVSYRVQEKHLWLPDLKNVIKTFQWIN